MNRTTVYRYVFVFEAGTHVNIFYLSGIGSKLKVGGRLIKSVAKKKIVFGYG